MFLNNKILIGKSKEKELFITPSMANRHGLITGASGSGKTITLKVMAESFSADGVPVFLADMKRLNISMPEIVARATKHIDCMEEYVKKIIENGYTYETENTIYFDNA